MVPLEGCRQAAIIPAVRSGALFMRFRLLLILLIAIAWPTAGRADYDSGLVAFNEGDYQAAFREWEPLAQDGDVDAQFALGYLYEYGEGVTQSYRQAAYWYGKAADAGDVDAAVAMGYLYESGLGVKQNFRRAVEYYGMASDQGDAYAMYYLARMVAEGRGTERDLVHAYTLFGVVAGSPDIDEETKTLAIEERTRLRSSLSAAQIQQADAVAAGLLGSGGGGGNVPSGETGRAVAGSGSGENATPQPNGGYMSDGSPAYVQGDDVRWVQEVLGLLGYDAGPADGTLGPKTEAAIRSFQRDIGLPADGQVSGELIAALEDIIDQVATLPPEESLDRVETTEEPPPAAEPDATGSGILLNARGQVLTNNHVIEDCRRLTVQLPGAPIVDAAAIAADAENDLAVVRITGAVDAEGYAAFRDGRSIRLADDVIAIGYPLTGLLSSQVKVTTGSVSALAGLYDDTRHMQISVPVQPGNSGGPLVDLAGNVVGVITSKLDAVAVAEATGDIPQNINFAIKSLVARSFLDANDVEYALAPSDTLLPPADAAELARRFTVLIACYE
jgi:S1-C subfamily serine protease